MKGRRRGPFLLPPPPPQANGNIPACGGAASGNTSGHLTERLLLRAAFPGAQDSCVSWTGTPGTCSISHSFGSERPLLVKPSKRHYQRHCSFRLFPCKTGEPWYYTPVCEEGVPLTCCQESQSWRKQKHGAPPMAMTTSSKRAWLPEDGHFSCGLCQATT